MNKAFLKEKIFTIIMIVMALAIVIMNLVKGEYTHMALWGIIALLNIATLVREFRKSEEQADKDQTT
jgi:hypothetical protein